MEIKIIDYGMNGEGVGKLEGKIILTNNALVDETVDVSIVEDNKNYSIAKTNKIISPSPERDIPKCPYFFACGGCDIQHLNYNEQLKFKTNHIKKTIKKITGLEVNVNKTIGCKTQFGYRNKMSFSLINNNCGLLKKNSKDIVKITSCPLATENINKVLTLFTEYISTNPQKDIKNLVIRDIENQLLIGIVTKKHIELKNFYNVLIKHFNNIGLYEIINTRNDSVVLSGKVNHIAGIKEININNFDLSYSVDLIGFHQINIDIQNKLYKNVLDYIDSNTTVVNGFSGQGLLTAILSKKAKHVYGIEINKSSHISAEQLKQNNNISNITNICGDFFKNIDAFKTKANTIILDPTKKGCGKEVMNKINGIENIIYISCNPIALSKDLNVIKESYIIESVTPFDMFPNTTSVETLVKLKFKGEN